MELCVFNIIHFIGITIDLIEESLISFAKYELAWPGLEFINLEFNLRLKIKRNDWLLADTCPQAANHCALFWVCDCTQVL